MSGNSPYSRAPKAPVTSPATSTANPILSSEDDAEVGEAVGEVGSEVRLRCVSPVAEELVRIVAVLGVVANWPGQQEIPMEVNPRLVTTQGQKTNRH